MSNTQAERVEALAAQHGTRYVNRHFPDKASYGFSQEQLQAFVLALAEARTPAGMAPEHWALYLGNDHPLRSEIVHLGWKVFNNEIHPIAMASEVVQLFAARNTTQQQGG